MHALNVAGARERAPFKPGSASSASASVPAPAAPVGVSYWSKEDRTMTDRYVFVAACVIATIVCVGFALGVIQ